MISDKLKGNVENYYTYKPFYILQLFRDKDHVAGKDYQQTILLDIALQKAKPTLSLLTIRRSLQLWMNRILQRRLPF